MRIGITGHRGLRPEVEAQVRTLLAAEIQQHDPSRLICVSCIADGPDTWAAQEVLRLGGRLEAVIPADGYRESLPEEHHPTYDRLMDSASEIHHTGLAQSDSAAHMAGSEIVVGLADEVLAVWDGLPAWGYGGTADVVEYAKRQGVPVRIIWPNGASR
ncbi:hypothetical protein [Streptomyces sp. NPDC001743]|uniref:hypothetical protein n=1 Tax=Streptomyces sp. NPDC001743 TaxID=3154397 RepID=UPI0033190448